MRMLHRKTAIRRSLAALIVPWIATTAFAQEIAMTPDLKDIASAGEIVIGVRESAVPFSFLTRSGSPSGYTIAICNKVADNLRKILNKPDLRVTYNSVTPLTRTLLVRAKIVDIECGATSHTASRADEFAFSVAFGVEQAALVSNIDAPIKNLDELSGKRLLVTDGSTSEAFLRERKAAGLLKAEIVPVRTAARAYYALTDGKADAYYGSAEILMGDVARRGGDLTKLRITPVSASPLEPLAVMLHKDRPGLKAVVDRTLTELAQSGELRAVYRTWFEQAMPGYNVNLSLAPSEAWQAMLKQPNDRPAH